MEIVVASLGLFILVLSLLCRHEMAESTRLQLRCRNLQKLVCDQQLVHEDERDMLEARITLIRAGVLNANSLDDCRSLFEWSE